MMAYSALLNPQHSYSYLNRPRSDQEGHMLWQGLLSNETDLIYQEKDCIDFEK